MARREPWGAQGAVRRLVGVEMLMRSLLLRPPPEKPLTAADGGGRCGRRAGAADGGREYETATSSGAWQAAPVGIGN